jgi:hypothetical protein
MCGNSNVTVQSEGHIASSCKELVALSMEFWLLASQSCQKNHVLWRGSVLFVMLASMKHQTCEVRVQKTAWELLLLVSSSNQTLERHAQEGTLVFPSLVSLSRQKGESLAKLAIPSKHPENKDPSRTGFAAVYATGHPQAA